MTPPVQCVYTGGLVMVRTLSYNHIKRHLQLSPSTVKCIHLHTQLYCELVQIKAGSVLEADSHSVFRLWLTTLGMPDSMDAVYGHIKRQSSWGKSQWRLMLIQYNSRTATSWFHSLKHLPCTTERVLLHEGLGTKLIARSCSFMDISFEV